MEAPRLFRVWSEDQKTYDYKFPYNSTGQFYISENGVLFSDFGNAVAPEVRQQAFVVEWFTGHYDKNGKPIYTGDIVKMPDWFNKPKYEVVRFTKSSVGFEPFVNGCFECAAPDGEEVEIVGTIHQNPELLEKRY